MKKLPLSKSLFVYLFVLLIVLVSLGCLGIGGKPSDKQVDSDIQENATAQSNESRTTIIIKEDPGRPIGIEPGMQDDEPVVDNTQQDYINTPEASFAIYFMDLDSDRLQGDAILIKKGDFDMVVDTGNNLSINKVVDFLKSKAVDDIEVLVSTHADEEHYGAMEEVIKQFEIGEFWWPGLSYGDAKYDAVINKIREKNIPIKEVKLGDNFTFNGLDIQVLNPGFSKKFNDADNDGVVLMIRQNNFCIMLTADILFGAQGIIANLPNTNIKCEIMQLPGHGLGKSNVQIGFLLNKILPRNVIMSGSSYDPAPDPKGTRFTVFEKLKAILPNTKVYETYKGGTVRITSDGNAYDIEYI